MRTVSANDLLTAWEAGQRQPHWERALNLLAAACPGSARSALLELSAGERDHLLLELRELVFGPDLEALVDCPECRACLQFALPVAGLLAPPARPSGELEASGYRIEFRPVNSGDLRHLRDASDLTNARTILVGRCVQKAVYQGKQVAAADLPPELIQALADALEESDPQANVEFALVCASCGHRWQQLFDVVAFLWAEIHAWAMRAFYEVHQLASAYGWSEAEILAMNPARRQIYLEMMGT
jgi:hypothetical protein